MLNEEKRRGITGKNIDKLGKVQYIDSFYRLLNIYISKKEKHC